uniref:Immunoglobulin domain-containing protein n=1 Tax=Lates calcarifer TaxID=8187 RepID=A0A4W6DW94_LATCA
FQWKALTYFTDSKLLFVFSTALLTGNHEDKLLKMRTGEDVTVQCFFTSFGISKFFCKDSCQEKVLVGTAGDRAQRDRYSIRYLTGTRGGSFLFVTITNLTKSDSGQYWCALDSSSLRDFELIVTDGEFLLN